MQMWWRELKSVVFKLVTYAVFIYASFWAAAYYGWLVIGDLFEKHNWFIALLILPFQGFGGFLRTMAVTGAGAFLAWVVTTIQGRHHNKVEREERALKRQHELQKLALEHWAKFVKTRNSKVRAEMWQQAVQQGMPLMLHLFDRFSEREQRGYEDAAKKNGLKVYYAPPAEILDANPREADDEPYPPPRQIRDRPSLPPHLRRDYDDDDYRGY